MCRVTVLLSGEQGCSYTLEEVKQLLLADVELATFRTSAPLRLQQVSELRLAVAAEKVRGVDLGSVNLRLQERVDGLTTERLSCDKDLQEERSKPRFGSPFAWIITGIAVSLSAGVLLAWYLR